MSPYTPFRSRRGIHHFFLIRFLENFWFFFLKSSWGMKLVLVGIICVFFGLFFPWIQIGTTTQLGAFSLLCGGVGWWMSILLILLLIHFFSYDYSQKIQKQWHVSLDPKDIYLRTGGLIIFMTLIVGTSLLGAARTVNGNIVIKTDISGLAITILGGIFLCLGGIVVRRSEEKESYKHIFVQGVEDEDQASYKKILGDTGEENMKLPI